MTEEQCEEHNKCELIVMDSWHKQEFLMRFSSEKRFIEWLYYSLDILAINSNSQATVYRAITLTISCLRVKHLMSTLTVLEFSLVSNISSTSTQMYVNLCVNSTVAMYIKGVFVQ